jgi:nicotinamidase-related amidase
MKSRLGGFGSKMPGDFGRLLMRGERNADLYGPLQAEYLQGKEHGTDMWIHKNRSVCLCLTNAEYPLKDAFRMSGLWGYQTALDLYLQENGINTLFFAGVNADQVREGMSTAGCHV